MTFKAVMTLSYTGMPHDEEAYKKADIEFLIIPCKTEDDLITATQDADAVITAMQPFTRNVIEKMTQCKLIHSLGVGYEGIDVKAATGHGICVSYTPDYCLEEVSDHAMALILACARKITRLDKAVRAGKWDSVLKPEIRTKLWPPMFRLRGQTLGLIGFGNIPRTLVPKAKGFGLRILAYDPYVPPNVFEEYEVERVELDRLLQESDFVSIHTALTPETGHMLGVEQLKKMKPTAYLINTARGPIIDEQALFTSLSKGWIAGAGLDVLETEPEGIPPGHPLLKFDNLIITAHSAHYSEESGWEIRRRPYEEICRIKEDNWPRCFLNPEVKEKFLSKWGKLGV